MRETLRTIIFGTESKAGRLFDILLIIAIGLSVLFTMLDSIPVYNEAFGDVFNQIEWGFTILFTVEYLVRIFCSLKATRYVFSFLGFIDLLAILPSYLSLLVPGTQVLTVIRVLRVLRVFRVLKLAQYIGEADLLMTAIRASKRKIFIFLFFVMSVVILLGSVMYLVVGQESGFDSIPRSIYWAIVTLTTVGYGDISPATSLGQFIAATIMVMGWGILAVPTGIVTSEISTASQVQRSLNAERTSSDSSDPCPSCNHKPLEKEARFCSHCGNSLI